MFKFPLQRVLELREKREQEVASVLQEARTSADQAHRECGELELVRDRGARSLSDARMTAATVGQLQNLSYVLQRLDQHLLDAQAAAERADEKVTLCLDDFTAAFRDRRVIDRLRERHLESWRETETQLDRKTMDALALTRHTKDMKSGGSS
ncbi:MAG TPA: flagellar export protein FliJ [Longimicrobiaceae bacterium]|nr:flagellar export protein FliJ [Longimicrobiaceae bacterium]